MTDPMDEVLSLPTVDEQILKVKHLHKTRETAQGLFHNNVFNEWLVRNKDRIVELSMAYGKYIEERGYPAGPHPTVEEQYRMARIQLGEIKE